MTQTFRKKPVEIEAVLFEGEHDVHDAAKWCGGRAVVEVSPRDHSDVFVAVDIPTLEGTMRAQRGDWIIRGVKGEFYPCKPDIFAATYEQTAGESLETQVARLAEFIMTTIPGEPSKDQGAIDTAIRLLRLIPLASFDIAAERDRARGLAAWFEQEIARQGTGVAAIAEERLRQIEVEGYTAEHDAEHPWAELALAAECYAGLAADLLAGAVALEVWPPNPPTDWPWSADAWKPSASPIRNAERAGALLAASIDQLIATGESFSAEVAE